MVDEERVTRLLGRIRADTRSLRRFEDVPPEQLQADSVALPAVKYHFVTAIEGCSRTAHHIVAAEGWSAPESNADAFRELADRGVLTSELGTALARAAGFRNVLVHQYVDVDDSLVVQALQRLDDLDEFAAQIAAWLLREQN